MTVLWSFSFHPITSAQLIFQGCLINRCMMLSTRFQPSKSSFKELNFTYVRCSLLLLDIAFLITVKYNLHVLRCNIFFFANQVLGILLHLRISYIDIQSLNQHKEKKSTVEMKIEKNKNRMEKKLKGKMSKKEKKV